MAKPFDAGVRVLIDQYLPDWLTISRRISHGAVRVIDSDLSTITAEADKLLLVDDLRPWILHLEPQANWDGELEDRVCWYNNIVGYKHECLVHSVIVFLRKDADSPRLTGEFVQAFPDDPPYRVFRYQVVRVWQMSADALASGPWGLFPLAPLCDDAIPQLPSLFEKMANRLKAEVHDPQKLSMLWEATAILSDLRHDPEIIFPLMQKVMTMVRWEDLKSHDMFVGKGIRRTIIALGKRKFGPPDESTSQQLEAIKDINRLEHLSERLLDVTNWQELLKGEAN